MWQKRKSMTPCQEMDVVIDPGAAEMYNQRLSGVRTQKNVLENAFVPPFNENQWCLM